MQTYYMIQNDPKPVPVYALPEGEKSPVLRSRKKSPLPDWYALISMGLDFGVSLALVALCVAFWLELL